MNRSTSHFIALLFNAQSYLEWKSYADEQDPLDSGGQFSNSHSESLSALSNADVLLAADVCYLIDLIPCLVKTVKRFLQLQPNASSVKKCAIFATTLRNKTTFDSFVDNLRNEGISCVFLHQSEIEQLPNIFPLYYVQPRSHIRICKLTIE